MSQHEVSVYKMPSMKMGATGLDRIKQNIGIICTTIAGTVPGDREFGISPIAIDKPIEYAKAMLTVQIMAAIERYEPNVIVKEITFDETDGAENYFYGTLVPIIKYEEREGI